MACEVVVTDLAPTAFRLQVLGDCALRCFRNMSAGLWDAQAAAPAQEEEEKKQERRTKLFGYDSVAVQMLEPYGEGALDGMTLREIWKGTVKGNKKCAYHSHLAADQAADPWRVGAGISMTAQALLAAVHNFRSDDMRNLLRPELYTKVKEEVDVLEPVLTAINFGKGSAGQKDAGSFREAKRAKLTASGSVESVLPAKNPTIAAVELRAWLLKEKSPFRSLLFVLSGKNSYYSGHVAELVARAAVQYKPMSEQDFIQAVAARMRKPEEKEGGNAAASDGTGLFDA